MEDKNVKRCEYCGISEKDCNTFFSENYRSTRKGHRGLKLERSKINAFGGRSKTNTVWACYICNNCKSNYCNSKKEFEPIAKGIREFWEKNGFII